MNITDAFQLALSGARIRCVHWHERDFVMKTDVSYEKIDTGVLTLHVTPGFFRYRAVPGRVEQFTPTIKQILEDWVAVDTGYETPRSAPARDADQPGWQP